MPTNFQKVKYSKYVLAVKSSRLFLIGTLRYLYLYVYPTIPCWAQLCKNLVIIFVGIHSQLSTLFFSVDGQQW